MSAYFRKSIKIAPGVHINLSKRGTGLSFGTRGAHVSFSPTGRVTKTVGIPGTGIYYRDVSTAHSRSTKPATKHVATEAPAQTYEPTSYADATTPETNALAIHHVEAVEHHGFYISHGVAAVLSFAAASIIGAMHKSQTISPWEPILGSIGIVSLIFWFRDIWLTAKESGRNHG